MALAREGDVFLCPNPRCPRQIGLKALLNEIILDYERTVGPDGVPAKRRGYVYILHFDQPIGTERKQAQHYTGWSRYLPARIEAHRQRRGAKIMRFVVSIGISFSIGFIGPGSPAFETKIKRQKNARRFCLICNRPVVCNDADDLI